MSIDLAIKLTCHVRLESLLSGTEKALQEILRLSRSPSVKAEVQSSAQPALRPSSVLDSDLGMLKVMIRDWDDDPVFLFASDRGGEPSTGRERGTFGVVEVHGDSVGLALAAAVAVAIARECESEIEDNGPVFTSEFETSPDRFLKNIRLENVSDDLGLAAEDFRISIAQKQVPR